MQNEILNAIPMKEYKRPLENLLNCKIYFLKVQYVIMQRPKRRELRIRALSNSKPYE